MTDWIGEYGMLKKLSVQYRGMDTPNGPIIAKGIVVKKGVDGEIECNIWLENSSGEKTTPGSATVYLPSRSS